MNRLQKKCVVVSVGLHLLLPVVLLFGVGFFSPSAKVENLPMINFVPLKTIDQAFSGGGNPNAKPPPAALPAPPAPQPQQQVIAPPSPPAEPVKVPNPEPPKPNPPKTESREATKPAKAEHRIVVNTIPVVRGQKEIDKARVKTEQEQARTAAEQRQRLAAAIGRTVNGIKQNLSPATTVELQGPGSGGIPYGNFLAAVRKAYTDPWNVPAGVTDDVATTVSVTIARDGTVISARIIKFSGNAEVDRSVQSVLDRVKFAAPLPEGAKEDQRTVTIIFDVSAKLLG